MSNPDEFPDPVQTVVLVTVRENREGMWGAREGSSLTMMEMPSSMSYR